VSVHTGPPGFDAKQFRTVLGHFPTGVTIVTGMNGDQPAGFTIGSFTSVSLDPPMVGFLPMTNSITWEAIAPSDRFCVNVLSRAQSDLCWKFAKSGNELDRLALATERLRLSINMAIQRLTKKGGGGPTGS